MWLATGSFPHPGSSLALLRVVFVKPLCTNCLCKTALFYFKWKDKYLGAFGVVLSNTVFIRLTDRSIVKLGNTVCGWFTRNLLETLSQHWLFSCDLLRCCVITIPGEENLYMETISNPSDAADSPIFPIVTINEADMSAAMGDEGLQLSGIGTEDEISLKGPPVASAGPNSTTCRCASKQKKVTSSDVLRLQYETLQCKKETLLLKKVKLELQIKLLEKQLPWSEGQPEFMHWSTWKIDISSQANLPPL